MSTTTLIPWSDHPYIGRVCCLCRPGAQPSEFCIPYGAYNCGGSELLFCVVTVGHTANTRGTNCAIPESCFVPCDPASPQTRAMLDRFYKALVRRPAHRHAPALRKRRKVSEYFQNATTQKRTTPNGSGHSQQTARSRRSRTDAAPLCNPPPRRRYAQRSSRRDALGLRRSFE